MFLLKRHNTVGAAADAEKEEYVFRNPMDKHTFFHRNDAGVPIVSHIYSDDGDYEEAANEHKRPFISIFTSPDEIGKRYGVGVQMYFEFIKYLIKCNMLLTLASCISFIPHVIDVSDNDPTVQDIFYLSAYAPKLYPAWVVSVSVSIILWAYFGFRFTKWANKFMENEQEIADVMEEQGSVATDIIEENRMIPPSQLPARLFASWFIFGCTLGGSGYITYLISLQDDGSSAYVSFAIAFFVTAVNFVWKRMCYVLTNIEKQQTWTGYWKSNITKQFSFKFTNIIVLYVAKKIAIGSNSSCIIRSLGSQYFYLVMFELVGTNLFEVIYVNLMWKYELMMNVTKSNEEQRPPFDVAEEYLGVLNQQLVIYLGSIVFPMITVLGVVDLILDFYLDKWKLFRICRSPIVRGSMHKYLSVFMIATALAASFAYPYGAFWMLGGFVDNMDDTCAIYNF